MPKRDIIYDTKAGRTSLAILAVFLLVLGLVLLVLSILLVRAHKDVIWPTLVLGISSVVYGICNLIVLKRRPPRVLSDDDTVDNTVDKPAPVQLPQEPDELIVVNPTKAEA